MKSRKWVAAVAMIVGLLMLGTASEAARAVTAAKARGLLRKAMAAERKGDHKTPSLYLQAFAEAISLTQPTLSAGLREEGFLLAARCRHADLIPQVQLAINTYLKVFPRGKKRADVLIELARLDLALGAPAAAVTALNEAEELIDEDQTGAVADLRYRALHELHRYRDAQGMAGQAARSPDAGLADWGAREYSRFEKADAKVAQALREVETLVHPAERAAMLAAYANVFALAALAPQAALLANVERDRIEPLYHARAVRFLGRERWVMHRQTAAQREATHRDFLARFPQAEPELTGFALHELHAIALHEKHDQAAAAGWLDQLERVPGWEERAIVGRLLMNLANKSIVGSDTFALLQELAKHRAVLPYDDGWWPQLSRQRLAQLMVYAGLAQNQPSRARSFLADADFAGTWRGIPVRWLAELAIKDRPATLRRELDEQKARLDPRDVALLERFLMPMHRPTPPLERKALTALLLMHEFPHTAMDLLVEVLGKSRDHRFSDHLLAALAQAYQEHMQPSEAQAVWNQLRRLYPHSVWLR